MSYTIEITSLNKNIPQKLCEGKGDSNVEVSGIVAVTAIITRPSIINGVPSTWESSRQFLITPCSQCPFRDLYQDDPRIIRSNEENIGCNNCSSVTAQQDDVKAIYEATRALIESGVTSIAPQIV